MPPSSPEVPTRKRKESITNLKRDQPLFASRRIAPSQQPPEFFTESLNTSYVPSPSPARSPPKRQHGRGKSRQFSTAGRSLAAAFKAAPSVSDENQRPISSFSSPDQRPAQHDRKPLPSQSNARPRSSPAVPVGDDVRVRTPSPARGRDQSLVSPASSYHSQSSPPRGLAEAYQRIVDEESLAQEESIDGMDAYGYDYNEGPGDAELSGPDAISDTASPTSLKASRKASREPTPVRQYSDNKENSLQHSENGSQRSSLDETERSGDSRMSQYERDSQRLNGALRSNVKIFSKARVGERVGLTVENLRRRNDSSESLGSAFGGSISSRGTDPSLNLPKAWGRKAKPPKDWLSRINSKSGKLTGDVPTKQKADSPIIAESERREWDEPIDEWIQAAADVPLPSEENGSSQIRSSSMSNTSIPPNALRDRASGWDVDADFTGRSLQVSDSPPLRIRNVSSDETRNREIDRLEKSAVATSRLGEIRERTSRERLGQMTPQNGGRTSMQDRRRSISRSSRSSKREERLLDNRIEGTLEDDGKPIPDTPVVVYRSMPDLKKTSSSTDRHRDPAERPSPERHDSRDILQKLARATSASPVSTSEGHSTSIDARAQQRPGSVGLSGAKKERSSSREQNRPDISNDDLQTDKRMSQTAPQVEETPLPTKPKARLKTPHITGGWIDHTISEESPRPPVPNVTLKTPMVTGAWVDTPLPAGGRGPPMPTPNVEDDKDFILEGNEKRKLATSDLVKKLSPKYDTKPERSTTSRPLPKSALESVITAAKASLASGYQPGQNPLIAHSSDSEEEGAEEGSPLQLGESTIQSLEEILADNDNRSSLPSAPSPSASEENDETETPATDDLKPYTRQLSRLSALLPSIRDARKNIASLERAVASSTTNRNRTLTLAPQNKKGNNPPDSELAEPECTEAGEFHDFIWPCSKCGRRSPSSASPPSLITLNIFQSSSSSSSPSLTTISLPLPTLWRRRSSHSYIPRFTPLGLLLVLGTLWYVAETVTCNIYCHPRYAYAFDGYGVDIYAPEPPFVFEKMLWRWLGGEAGESVGVRAGGRERLRSSKRASLVEEEGAGWLDQIARGAYVLLRALGSNNNNLSRQTHVSRAPSTPRI
ncbi:MAG: hypothetical protein Q9191_004260 [Dirinaria sp. TL-2023a]